MQAAATLERKDKKWTSSRPSSKDSIIHFEEGLIGFPECKEFVLMENDHMAPFRMLQSTEKPEIGFVVLDPTTVVNNYFGAIPPREWEALEVTGSTAFL